MVTPIAKKPIKNQIMVICDHQGIVWQKSNIAFLMNFAIPRYKKNCIEPPLNFLFFDS